MKPQTLDVSEMEAPGPLITVLNALADNPDQVLIVKHRIAPMGLYKKLNEMKRRYHTEKKSELLFLITIYPEENRD